jgi:hypothetical protein
VLSQGDNRTQPGILCRGDNRTGAQGLPQTDNRVQPAILAINKASWICYVPEGLNDGSLARIARIINRRARRPSAAGRLRVGLVRLSGPYRDRILLSPFPGNSCQATIIESLRDIDSVQRTRLNRDHLAYSVLFHVGTEPRSNNFAALHHRVRVSELMREIVVLLDQQNCEPTL